MFEKELWISVTSDNLVCQFRRAAAKQAQLPERRLSFKRELTTFKTFLLRKLFSTPGEWRRAFDQALHYAQQDKLPNRPNRHYEREAYHQRRKSAGLKNAQRKPMLSYDQSKVSAIGRKPAGSPIVLLAM